MAVFSHKFRLVNISQERQFLTKIYVPFKRCLILFQLFCSVYLLDPRTPNIVQPRFLPK